MMTIFKMVDSPPQTESLKVVCGVYSVNVLAVSERVLRQRRLSKLLADEPSALILKTTQKPTFRINKLLYFSRICTLISL